jgi:chorismate synthase
MAPAALQMRGGWLPARHSLRRRKFRPISIAASPASRGFVTQRREPDAVKILSGVLTEDDGVTLVTTGTPIAMMIENVDQRSKDYGEIARQFRPGHADYAYEVKYGIRDHRVR